MRHQVIEAMVADRSAQKQKALVSLFLGIAFCFGSILLTLSSDGRIIWFGVGLAGTGLVVRSAITLAKLRISSD